MIKRLCGCGLLFVTAVVPDVLRSLCFQQLFTCVIAVNRINTQVYRISLTFSVGRKFQIHKERAVDWGTVSEGDGTLSALPQPRLRRGLCARPGGACTGPGQTAGSSAPGAPLVMQAPDSSCRSLSVCSVDGGDSRKLGSVGPTCHPGCQAGPGLAVLQHGPCSSSPSSPISLGTPSPQGTALESALVLDLAGSLPQAASLGPGSRGTLRT